MDSHQATITVEYRSPIEIHILHIDTYTYYYYLTINYSNLHDI